MGQPTSEPEAHLAFLEAAVDASADAVFEIVDGVVASWNRSAERIFGRPAADVLGTPVLALFVPDGRATVEWLLGIVRSGDQIERFEIDVETHHGMPTPIALTLRPVFAPGGAVATIAAVAQDLTEQRVAQATFAETEARLREGEARAHVGRWLWDIGTGAVQWSDELHRIHGVDPWDFGGDREAHLALVPAPDRERVVHVLDDAVARHRAVEVEYEIERTDGQRRRVYARAEPTIGPTGEVVGLRGTISDVTGAATNP